MPGRWKVKDAEFHMRRADAERRAALRASSEEAAAAHRRLALEHQAAVFLATRPRDVPAFDEAEFLSFALRVAVPSKGDRADGLIEVKTISANASLSGA